MTCCVAALADNARTIILASDRQITFPMISTDPPTIKIKQLHPNWWMMYSGDDVSPAFLIGDAIQDALLELSGGQEAVDAGKPQPPKVPEVEAAVQRCVLEHLNHDAEALYLRPLGYTLESFKLAAPALPDDLVKDTYKKIGAYGVPIDLLFAGFDRLGYGYVFTIQGDAVRIRRYDNPGYVAIGGGADAAMYWMGYRDIGYGSNSREVLYSAVEGKYFAELSAGVGEFTDVFILRSGHPNIQLSDERIDEAIIRPMCRQLEPHRITDKYRKQLNAIPEINHLPELELENPPKPQRQPDPE